MDRRKIVNRLSRLFSLRKDPFVICVNRLLRFGYQDIEIDIPIYENSRESEEYCAEIRKMTIKFSHQDYQYHMEVQCADGYAAPENICRFFSKIIEYIVKPEEMQTVNVGREYPVFLAEHVFADVSQEGEVSSNTANLVAFRGDTKYHMKFHRRCEQEVLITHCENSRDIDISTERITFFLDRFQQALEQQETLYQFQGEHHIELAKDLSQLDITLFHGWSRSHLSISSEPLSVQIAEDLFRNVVRCWMRAECKDELLTDMIISYGHVPQNFTDNNNSFEVLNNGIKYSISTRKDELVDFDHMDGHAFEYFCAEILSLNGFSDVEVTQGSRDQGVDIIAYKDDIKYGIQCKCYASDIGNKAVQEVYAGKNFYNCDVAAVLTNRYFTKSAVELAQKNRVHLWNRDKLSDLIENCKERLLGTD